LGKYKAAGGQRKVSMVLGRKAKALYEAFAFE
jgi:hypothetical protein